MLPTQVVEVYLNDKNQIVAKDSQKKWRIYNPQTQRLTLFADGPPRGAKPLKPPEPEEVEVVRETDPTVVHIDEQMRQLVEQMNHKEENEQLRQKVTELNRQLEAEKNTPRADPAEIERLKQENATLTVKHSDAVAAKKKAEEDLKAKPAPAPPARELFYRRWWKEYPGWVLGGGGVLALLLLLLILFASYGWRQYWHPSTYQTTLNSTPSDYDSIRSQVAALQAKADAEEKAKKDLAERLKKLPPLVILKHLDTDPDAN